MELVAENTDDKIIDFRKERSIRLDDNKLWSPVECLEDFIQDINNGVISPDSLVIMYTEGKDESVTKYGFSASNSRVSESVTLLERIKLRMLGVFD